MKWKARLFRGPSVFSLSHLESKPRIVSSDRGNPQNFKSSRVGGPGDTKPSSLRSCIRRHFSQETECKGKQLCQLREESASDKG